MGKEIDFEGNEVSGDELSLEDLTPKFIKNPKVGESITLNIAKVIVNKNTKKKDKNGRQFNTALSGVDYNWEIHTVDDRVYTCSTWEIVGKLKEIFKTQGKTKGITVTIKHVADGKLGKKGDSNYTVEVK
jgi:hypothetical protein